MVADRGVQERYSKPLIWAWLRSYRGAATIMPTRDDRISSTRPLNDAGVSETFERGAIRNADLERALQICAPWEICVVVQAVSLLRGDKWDYWTRVGQPWGLSSGDVHKLTEDVVERMHEFINRTPRLGPV